MDDAITDVDVLFIRIERRVFFCITGIGITAFMICNLVGLLAAYPRQCRAVFGLICFGFLGCLVRSASIRCGLTHRLCLYFQKVRRAREGIDL